MLGFFLSLGFLIICFILVIKNLLNAKKQTSSDSDTIYAKTKNFMDFNHGEDLEKIGDCNYPTAGIDSVIKTEVLDNLLDEEKQFSHH